MDTMKDGVKILCGEYRVIRQRFDQVLANSSVMAKLIMPEAAIEAYNNCLIIKVNRGRSYLIKENMVKHEIILDVDDDNHFEDLKMSYILKKAWLNQYFIKKANV